MRATFQVLDDGWIPVITADGEERLLGVRQTILQAHALREISCASPLEEYAVYRFLGLFLMDALRPESESDLEDLLEQGHFSKDALERYISVCRSEGVSFDLFDEARPFLQSRFDPAYEKEVKSTGVLDCTRPSGDNHTHFVHERDRISCQPDKALRLLLATYCFCQQGGRGYYTGICGDPPYYSVIKGRSLFETLVYLLVPTDSISIPFSDPPILWRRMDPIEPGKQIGAVSWLQGMLFPSRRIHLISNQSGNVIGSYYCPGENYANKKSWRDPYVTYVNQKDELLPLRPDADRAIWRNLCDIVDIPGNRAPLVLELYRRIYIGQRVEMAVYGLETDKAKRIALYRHDLSFPLSLTESESNVELLSLCIASSEELARALKQALTNTNALRDGDAAAAVREYYRQCEARFWALCEEAANAADRRSLRASFCADVCAIADRVFQEQLSGRNLRAAALAAAADQRGRLQKAIRKIKKEASQ